jgi:hypothetical protein
LILQLPNKINPFLLLPDLAAGESISNFSSLLMPRQNQRNTNESEMTVYLKPPPNIANSLLIEKSNLGIRLLFIPE